MKNQGFTLFIAIVVMGTLLLIATGVTNLALKQAFISTSGRISQNAFYAADTGMECALYWDVKNPAGYSAFSTSTASTITCNNSGPLSVGGGGNGSVSSFTFTLAPDQFCAIVTVTKGVDGSTRIESKGYNTCDTTNSRRVERAVRAIY